MERKIDVEGCHNFRDLGGYPTVDGRAVRWRVLFRSDGLHELTPGGVGTVRDGLGIGHIVDLRTSTELSFDGRGPLADAEIAHHHLPIFDGDASADRERVAHLDLGELYLGMIEFASDRLAKILTTLATVDRPAVFHCSAGKDRTGVVSALILGSLGVREEIIVADYAATRDGLDGIVDRLQRSRGYEEMWKELPPETLHADPETMIGLLAGIRRTYGSVRDCVRQIGVADDTFAALEAKLLQGSA